MLCAYMCTTYSTCTVSGTCIVLQLISVGVAVLWIQIKGKSLTGFYDTELSGVFSISEFYEAPVGGVN